MGKDSPSFLKIAYFDEAAAQDYLDITNGGRLDWSKEENKKRVAEILAEIEAQAKGGFNIISFLKGSISGNLDATGKGEVSKLLDTTIKNTLLTDYISAACTDDKIIKFEDSGVYAPQNSVTLYKMYSSYLSVIPKEQLPFDKEICSPHRITEQAVYDTVLAVIQSQVSLALDLESALKELDGISWERRELERIERGIARQEEVIEYNKKMKAMV